MAFRTILSVVGPSTPDAFIREAAELAYDRGAHLTLLVTVLAAPPPIGDYGAMISDSWREEQQEDNRILNEKIASARALLDNMATSSGADGLYCEEAWVHAEIGTHALYSDLVLIGDARAIGTTLRRQAIVGALFDAGRPVLLAPSAAMPSLAARRILLAWDSSPYAAAAAREALELMKAAESVEIVMVDPRANEGAHGEEPGADIAAYLARHEIKLSVNRIPSGGLPVADVLQQRAEKMAADLIVMGAYGHSRLRERIFGGVTRSMIQNVRIPVLLAH